MSLTTYFESPKSYWLRWIGVLPLSIVVYIITSPIVKIILEFGMFWIPESIFNFIKMYLISFVAGMSSGQAYLMTGSMLAPKYKSLCALILTILMVLSIGVVITSGYENNEYNPWTENIGLLIGLILRYLIIRLENSEELI